MPDGEGMNLFQLEFGRGTNLQKGNAFFDNERYWGFWTG